MNSLRWISTLLLALAVAAGVGVVWQRQAAAALQAELGWLRDENRELVRLRGENERLRTAGLPAAEMEQRRADHAAIVRLRAEIEAMRVRLEKRAP